MESMCVNTMHIDADMVCPFCTYPNRRIYCDAGCIYGRFLDMDFEEKERECYVCNSMVCPLCIVYSNVLEVVGNILYYDKYVIFGGGIFCQPILGIIYIDKEKIYTSEGI